MPNAKKIEESETNDQSQGPDMIRMKTVISIAAEENAFKNGIIQMGDSDLTGLRRRTCQDHRRQPDPLPLQPMAVESNLPQRLKSGTQQGSE